MYWRYVALFTWPITSMSRNWTGSSMLNFTCDQRADRIRPNHREKSTAYINLNPMSQKWIIRLMIRPELLSEEEIFWSCIEE